MKTPQPAPQAQPEPARPGPSGDDAGSNEVEHQPDPTAKPIPDGEHKYVKRSPYTAGND
jgi:hypothetical protein